MYLFRKCPISYTMSTRARTGQSLVGYKIILGPILRCLFSEALKEKQNLIKFIVVRYLNVGYVTTIQVSDALVYGVHMNY